ncbi:Extracellular matrix-binding ebh, putative [Babesia ovata]|uniref:Extracellular matrix-binding ebh, putative n=1 Tax=Babesia ovata TaxID=189622 RepID=A0A2H6K7R5_9APIC|nr:Extracellular matrix-binding ebh, putative [Babesia ovata]GBE59030.1 Extracellular matrix-binding ebh, putative [Babesia ovata]
MMTLKSPTNSTDQAEEDLKTQVDSLHSWIGTAEEIRQKAQKKAEEAYSKLDVHAELSNNVQKIVDANKVIEGVHKGLNSFEKSLEAWNQQAGKVLDGAISKATEVHDSLNPDEKSKDGIGKSIEVINTSSESIKKANITLGAEVGNLQSWRSAAESVIQKANEKCNDILQKVQTDKNAPAGVIFKKAQTLQDMGKKLLQAAQKAKQEVGEKVTEALQAVVRMDKSLKVDLKGVKTEIKKGITEVITSLRVNDLDKEVIKDLGTLKERIEGLAKDLPNNGKNDLVKDKLEVLEKHKTSNLDIVVNKIKDETNTNLEKNFNEHIQQKLHNAVGAVDSAIEKLGGEFGLNSGQTQSENKVEKIFNKIKEEVYKILNGDGKKGLNGIATGLIHSYAKGFVNFNGIVGGWMEGTLGRDAKHGDDGKAPKTWLGYYVEERKNTGRSGDDAARQRRDEILAVRNGIKKAIGSTFEAAIGKACRTVEQTNGNIETTIKAVKQACEHFVRELDNELKTGIDNLADQIFKKSPEGSAAAGTKPYLKVAVEATLLGLSATTSQVANEIESILLGDYRVGNYGNNSTSIAAELDAVHGYTKALNDKLNKATQYGSKPPTPVPGTAQAVDSKLEAVRNMVNSTITDDFKKKVKHDLATEVGRLPIAIQQFDEKAQTQIRAAAKTAIGKTAGQFQMKSDGSEIDVEANMPTFHGTYDTIQKQLQGKLYAEVDTHIGKDHKSAKSWS